MVDTRVNVEIELHVAKRGEHLHTATIALLLAMLALVITLDCKKSGSDHEALRGTVLTALDTLAVGLVEDRPADERGYTERLQTYLEAHPLFFGSAAALLDHSGAIIASPYVYRTPAGYASLDLAAPSYNIDVDAASTGRRRIGDVYCRFRVRVS